MPEEWARTGGLKVLLPAVPSCPLPMPMLPVPDRPRAMPDPLDSCLTGACGAFRKGEGLGLPAGPAPGHADVSAHAKPAKQAWSGTSQPQEAASNSEWIVLCPLS